MLSAGSNYRLNVYGENTNVIYNVAQMLASGVDKVSKLSLYMPIYRFDMYVCNARANTQDTYYPESMRPSIAIFDPNTKSYRTGVFGSNQDTNLAA